MKAYYPTKKEYVNDILFNGIAPGESFALDYETAMALAILNFGEDAVYDGEIVILQIDLPEKESAAITEGLKGVDIVDAGAYIQNTESTPPEWIETDVITIEFREE